VIDSDRRTASQPWPPRSQVLIVTDKYSKRAAKVAATAVAAYALSPIDLIPDFIPVLGYLDDVIIVPLGILLAVRLVPPDLMAEFRAEAERREGCPTSRNAVHFAIRMAALKSMRVVGCGVRGRNG